MTAKSSRDRAHAELEEFKKAMQEARFATGEASILVANDPEDPGMLEGYRLGLNDASKVVEIGPSQYPGDHWYRQYAAAAKAGDHERASELLRHGATAVRGEGPPE
jgi:hypothetical protein